jgi:hypothetical protein
LLLVPPPRPPRPLANPDLFKPKVENPTDSSERTSSLKTAPPNRQGSPSTATGKSGGKWQPLTTLEPKAELEDHDPFSLGDSDEEPTESAKKEAKSAETSAPKKDAAAAGSSDAKPAEASKPGGS